MLRFYQSFSNATLEASASHGDVSINNQQKPSSPTQAWKQNVNYSL